MVALLAACAAATPVTVESPLPTLTDLPSIEPSPTPPPLIARRAVYQLGGVLYVYDVNADRVSQLTEPSNVRQPRWVDDERISFVRDAPGGRASALLVLDVASRNLEQLFQVPTGIATYDWSPDLDTVAYVTVDDFDYPQIHYRSVGTGSVRTVATLARQLGREGVDDDQVRVDFSPDGELVLIVYTLAEGDQDVPPEASQLQIRTVDGSLAYGADHADRPTMGTWTPDGSAVFFRIERGARAWLSAGGTLRGIPRSPRWYNPTVSPNGRLVAFDTGPSDPGVRVRLLDMRSGELTNFSRRGRALPVFATNRTVWAQRVRACSGECLVPAEFVTQVFAIDVRSGEERRLAMRSLVDADVLYG